MMQAKIRAAMDAQRPTAGADVEGKQARSLNLFDAIRKQFDGDPVVEFEGKRYVQLPVCDGCASWRWDDRKQRWFHHPECAQAASRRIQK